MLVCPGVYSHLPTAGGILGPQVLMGLVRLSREISLSRQVLRKMPGPGMGTLVIAVCLFEPISLFVKAIAVNNIKLYERGETKEANLYWRKKFCNKQKRKQQTTEGLDI